MLAHYSSVYKSILEQKLLRGQNMSFISQWLRLIGDSEEYTMLEMQESCSVHQNSGLQLVAFSETYN